MWAHSNCAKFVLLTIASGRSKPEVHINSKPTSMITTESPLTGKDQSQLLITKELWIWKCLQDMTIFEITHTNVSKSIY